MSKIFARLRRATFTILPRAGPLLSFCPKSTARRAFSVLTHIGRTFRIPSDYDVGAIMYTPRELRTHHPRSLLNYLHTLLQWTATCILFMPILSH